MPFIYSIENDGESTVYFPTRKAAIAAGYEMAAQSEHKTQVFKNETVPLTVENLVDIINSQGGDWLINRNIIMTIEAGLEP